MTKRLLVCGDRNWEDFDAVFREVKARMPDVVIEGEAEGADIMSRLAAEELGIPVLAFPALWRQYGRAAGPIRNQQMLDEGKPTEAIAFHANIENSRGTANMILKLKKAGIPYTLYEE